MNFSVPPPCVKVNSPTKIALLTLYKLTLKALKFSDKRFAMFIIVEIFHGFYGVEVGFVKHRLKGIFSHCSLKFVRV